MVIEILLAILCGPLLWLAGAVAFDAVHWVLHAMLRSRSAWLRALARPHGVHHEWIDRSLVTHEDRRRANVWCHIVPEYLTQLVFTAVVALLLPWPFAAVLFLLQTGVFLGILRAGGRDLNHRPAARIDAHPPGWGTPPAYHALHHAWPDAHFSAYTKLVDRLVGGGAQIAGRRFAWSGPASAFGRALRAEVERAGGLGVDGDGAEAATGGAGGLGTEGAEAAAERAALATEGVEAATERTKGLGGVLEGAAREADVLVLLDPRAALGPSVEAFIAATVDRQLPPEVWALRADAADGAARHYRDDVRVAFRTLLWREADARSASGPECRRAARRALFWIRRDAHFVAPGERLGVSALRRFLRAEPEAPAGAVRVRHRLDRVPAAGAGS